MAGDWHSRAACLGVDPDLFFPVGSTGPALGALADAQRVCARCPVREDCLRWALDNDIDHGVWGGVGEDQRRSLRRRSARNRNSRSLRASEVRGAREIEWQGSGDGVPRSRTR